MEKRQYAVGEKRGIYQGVKVPIALLDAVIIGGITLLFIIMIIVC